MLIPLPLAASDAPEVPLLHIDQLWFQVGGTLCNYTCHHCFISCSPHNRSFGLLTCAEIERWLQESVTWGVKEYYFTGGEPFLNPEMTEILERTLDYGPVSVLTNASVLRDDWLRRLRAAEERHGYSLEWRVSLDGFTPEMNDAIRGQGTFARTLKGICLLVQYDFLPIITVTPGDDGFSVAERVDRFVDLLRGIGYHRPRLKILPTLRLGAEAKRHGSYDSDQYVTKDMMNNYDVSDLLCSHARLVSDRGVHVCPILLEAPDALLGRSLSEAVRPYRLRHHACWTCYQYGSICANPSGSMNEA